MMGYPDMFGRMPDPVALAAAREKIAGMMFPVRCTWCGGVYDLAKVEVTARYADCSMWKAPCCGAQVDDRGETGRKSREDYVRLGPDGQEARNG
jgi:hypothetical protein